jgi:hypothetical protein
MQTYPTADAAWLRWSREDVKRLRIAIYQLADGTFVGLPSTAPRPPGSQRLKPQPAYPTTPTDDPREGTREAMKTLETRYPDEIRHACQIAVEIARRKLTVHSREVREEMERRKLIGADTGNEYWLGAAMNRLAREKILERTGHTYKYTDAARGVHERTVTIWQLREGADTTAYDPPRYNLAGTETGRLSSGAISNTPKGKVE